MGEAGMPEALQQFQDIDTVGHSDTVRTQFASNGTLTGEQPAWTTGGVVGIAHDLGSVSTETSITFAIGYVREKAVNYLSSDRTGYYRATYKDTVSAVSHFWMTTPMPRPSHKAWIQASRARPHLPPEQITRTL
jgi:hypothetical protein